MSIIIVINLEKHLKVKLYIFNYKEENYIILVSLALLKVERLSNYLRLNIIVLYIGVLPLLINT